MHKKIHDLCSLANIIVTKQERDNRTMRRVQEQKSQDYGGGRLRKGNLKDRRVDGNTILNWICQKLIGKVCTEFICINIRTSGQLLWMRYWTYAFHRMWGISWHAEELLASEAEICSTELVTFYHASTYRQIFQAIFRFPEYLQAVFTKRPAPQAERSRVRFPMSLNFVWHNPSGPTMALGLTQSLTEMSTRNVSWGVKAAGA